jgi:hypothetical protein
LLIVQRKVAKGVYSLDIPQLDSISEEAKEQMSFHL